MKTLLNEADKLDRLDTLSKYRNYFMIPNGMQYFCGHSLGAIPSQVKKTMEAVLVKECGQMLIDGWNEAEWIFLPEKLGNIIARLVGADKGDVIVCDSTTINLYKAIHLAIKLNPKGSGSIRTDNFKVVLMNEEL